MDGDKAMRGRATEHSITQPPGAAVGISVCHLYPKLLVALISSIGLGLGLLQSGRSCLPRDLAIGYQSNYKNNAVLVNVQDFEYRFCVRVGVIDHIPPNLLRAS